MTGDEISQGALEILKFIRTVPGRVYIDQLKSYSWTEIEDIDYALKELVEHGYLEQDLEHADEGYVTIPKNRQRYEEALLKIGDELVCTENRTYQIRSMSGYTNVFQIIDSNERIIGRLERNPINNEVLIDLSSIDNNKQLILDNFMLDSLLHECCSMRDYHLGKIQAKNVRFTGKTNLSLLRRTFSEGRGRVTGLFDFSNSVFEDNVFVGNFDYWADGNQMYAFPEKEGLLFRDCRFLSDVEFSNIRMINSSKNTQISLEDAHVHGKLEFKNMDIGEASINCFQMIVGEKKEINEVKLSNISMGEGATLNFSKVNWAKKGKMIFQHIPVIPNCNLCFEKEECLDLFLEFDNCSLHGIMEIANVSELCFKDFVNLGTIIEAPETLWGKKKEKKKKKTSNRIINAVKSFFAKKRGIEKQKEKKKDCSCLIEAVKSYISSTINELDDKKKTAKQTMRNTMRKEEKEKAKKEQEEAKKEKKEVYIKGVSSMRVLKKNFEALGDNDAEDAALIGYMNYKSAKFPKNAIYRLLYATGKYGTSPLRIILCSGIVWFVFSGLFFFANWYLRLGFFKRVWNGVKFSSQNMIFLLAGFSPMIDEVTPYFLVSCIVECVLETLLFGYFAIAIVRKTMR